MMNNKKNYELFKNVQYFTEDFWDYFLENFLVNICTN
jgi:hypothetical protein